MHSSRSKELAPGRDEHTPGRVPNYDPNSSHHSNTLGSDGKYTVRPVTVHPAGVDPDFDGFEYDDDSVPPDLH